MFARAGACMDVEFWKLKTVAAIKIRETYLQRIILAFWIEICSLVLSGMQAAELNLCLYVYGLLFNHRSCVRAS